MGGRWSITARNLKDDCEQVCNYNLSFIKWVIMSIYCLYRLKGVEG